MVSIVKNENCVCVDARVNKRMLITIGNVRIPRAHKTPSSPLPPDEKENERARAWVPASSRRKAINFTFSYFQIEPHRQ